LEIQFMRGVLAGFVQAEIRQVMGKCNVEG
jgi:hypothetical protein